MKRTRIGKGIYKTAYGFAVIWPEGGRNREKHFAADTPLATLTAYRKQHVKMAAPPPVRAAGGAASFARLVVRYLRLRKGRPSYGSERSHLKAWVMRVGRQGPQAITRDLIEGTMTEWALGGLSPKTLRHRLNVLTQVLKLVSAPEQGTIVDHIARPKVPKRRAQGVPDTIIATVAAKLADQERAGKLRDGKTRARFLVLATTGKRPCQLQRATPIHVDLERRVWHVEPAKNSHGGPIYLNDEMLWAWHAFIAADAWGDYDSVSFAKTLRRNGWPTGVRPYQLRHQTMQTADARGVDLGAIQQIAGHGSPETTRRFYAPGELASSRAASEALEGRFSAELFAETHRHKTGIRVGGTPTDDRDRPCAICQHPRFMHPLGGRCITRDCSCVRFQEPAETTKDYQGSGLGSAAISASESRETPAARPAETTKDLYQGTPRTGVDRSGFLRKSADGSRLVKRPSEPLEPSKTH